MTETHMVDALDGVTPSIPPESTASASRITDIFVAVHGIGMQRRSETIRSVATRLAGSRELLKGSAGIPVAPQPLGYFGSAVKNRTGVHQVDDPIVLHKAPLATIGVAEIFWSDIPQQVINEGRTLEETKAWARTVVARAKATYLRAKVDRTTIVPPDFGLATEVLEEIIETVAILENLCFLSEKAGLFKFNMAEVLEEYAGDVQLVTEFEYNRTDVVGRFHAAMESIYAQYIENSPVKEKVRIHIVAHSEGTVVSLLGLLHAISKQRVVPADSSTNQAATIIKDEQDFPPWWKKGFPPWLRHVTGFMTIGSPIDKHLLLWPRIWEEFKPSLANGEKIRIRWRNYYDLADPIGFELDTARLWLEKVNCKAFEFCNCEKCHNDMGFARYLFPGLAHNEYWNDQVVFDHFIGSVLPPEKPESKSPPEEPESKPGPEEPAPKPPGNHWYAKWFSPWLLYVVCLLLLAAGVFVIFNAMQHYTHPAGDPLQVYLRDKLFKPGPGDDLAELGFARAVAGITALMAGASLLGCVPRLARNHWWVGLIAILAGAGVYLRVVPQGIQEELGSVFYYCGSTAREWGILEWGTPVAAGVIGALCGFLGGARKNGLADRGERWLFRGARPLMITGTVLIVAVIVMQLWQPAQREYLNNSGLPGVSSKASPDEQKQEAKMILGAHLTMDDLKSVDTTNRMKDLDSALPALQVNPPLWPVLLAGAAFLYLWWLAVLIFDLGFVWNRYVRKSQLNKRLQGWNPYDISPEKFREEDRKSKNRKCRKETLVN